MKKFFVCILALLFFVPIVFAAIADNEVTGAGDYYGARKAAKNAVADGNIDRAVKLFLIAENEASVLAASTDPATNNYTLWAEWQRNNAASALIEDFKTSTNWFTIMESIKAIPNGPERLDAAIKLKNIARPKIAALISALEILNGRKFLKAEVLAKVKSNKEFCLWVIDFCK